MSFAALMRAAAGNTKASHAALQSTREQEAVQKRQAADKAAEEAERQRKERERRSALQEAGAEQERRRQLREDLLLKERKERREAREREQQASAPPAKRRRLSDSPPTRPRQLSKTVKESRQRSSSPSVTDPRRVHEGERHKNLPASSLHGKAAFAATFDPYGIRELTPSDSKYDRRSVDELERDLHASNRDQPATVSSFFSGASQPGTFAAHKPSTGAISRATTAQTRPGEGISKTQSAAQVLPNGQLLPPVRRAVSAQRSPPPQPKVAIPKRIVAEEPRQYHSKPKFQHVVPPSPKGSSPKRGSPIGRSPVRRRSISPSPKSSSKTGDYADEIWKMFGRDRSQYVSQGANSDDESSDMEGGADELRREEQEAARMARMEDRREERLIAKRKQEKEDRKAAARP